MAGSGRPPLGTIGLAILVLSLGLVAAVRHGRRSDPGTGEGDPTASPPGRPSPTPAPRESPTPAPAPPERTPEGGAVLGRFEASAEVPGLAGEPVTVRDLFRELSARRDLASLGSAVLAASPEEALGLLRKATDAADVQEAAGFAVEARLASVLARSQPAPPSAAVEARLAARRARLERPGGPRLEDLVARRGGIEVVRRELAAELAVDAAVGAPPEAEVVRAFESTRDVYTGRRLRLAQLLVASEDDARAARAELAGGADWNKVVLARSIDSRTRATGGDLGWVKRDGDLPSAVAAAAFAAERGAPSLPAASRQGWHVTRWTEEEPGKPVTLEAVRDQVLDDLCRRRRLAHLGALRAKCSVSWVARP